jgi:mono/diheme cytochrome c family protein
VAIAVAGASAASACGREESPDLVTGKELFVQKCGSCHTLNRAGTKGVQAPNLDQAFGPARRDGLGEGTIEGVVKNQIANVRRGSIMPQDLVKGQAAEDVAAYVALVAGVGGKDTGELAQAGKPKVSNRPIRARGGILEIAADPTGALAFATTRAIAQAGRIEFVMPNESSVQHNIAVKNGGAEGTGPVVGQGGTSRFSTTLRRGKFTFFCSVPGHEAGGMKGELTVR